MNQVRKDIVTKAFAKFDKDGSGFISAVDLRYFKILKVN